MNTRFKTDDLENQRIYQESLHPTGIRQTVKVKDESLFKDLFNGMNKATPTRPAPVQRLNRRANVSTKEAEKIAIAAFISIFAISIMITIIGLVFS